MIGLVALKKMSKILQLNSQNPYFPKLPGAILDYSHARARLLTSVSNAAESLGKKQDVRRENGPHVKKILQKLGEALTN